MAINDTLGTPEQMLAWARGVMTSRPPDQIITDGDLPYMERWWIIPRNPAGGVYLHRILRSDKDVPHDHPWRNTSYVLEGVYKEQDLNGEYTIRVPGDIVHRAADRAHRLILPEGGIPVISLFLIGPWERDWGFHCPKGWVPWWEFVDPNDKGRVGRGCGEMA